MEMRAAGFSIVFVILVCAMAAGRAEGKRTAKMFFGNEAGWISLEMDQETAEQALSRCRKELVDRRDGIENFDLYMPQGAARELRSALLERGNILKAIHSLTPQMKQQLMDCLRNKDLLVVSHQEATYNQWLISRVELLFSWPNAARRYLASESQEQMASSPAPSLAAAPVVASPNYAPAPDRTQSPFLSPSPSPSSSPSPSPSPDKLAHHFPPNPSRSLNTPPTPKAHKHSPPPSQHPSKHHEVKLQKQIIVAVAVTASVTLSLVALLFICCLKNSRNKIGPRDEHREENPLINLSHNSSKKSTSLRNSSNRNFGINSGKCSSSHNLLTNLDNHDSSLAVAPSSGANASLSPLKPPPGRSAPPPPRPPPPPPARPRPPPPPKVAQPPPVPGKGNIQAAPIGSRGRGRGTSSEGNDVDGESGVPKAKLKPFFWDKVLASPNHSMVWHEISAGSFQFNEEKIESLFGYTAADNMKNERKKESSEPAIQYIQIIDGRKAQNLSILLRALNVTTEEVIDALQEGNELPTELLHTLLKMAPTQEEELKLRLYAGNVSQLGPAERFLKVLVEIPFAFKRVESLMFMNSFQEEVSIIKESFATLEVASNKLKNSRLFLKLLEAVLKTGNRMNDGTYRGGAQAFKLDTLLKLSDVKGIDGKTTLLHFVVQEIVRSEGVRAFRSARSNRRLSSMKSEDIQDDSTHASAEHYCSIGLQVVSGLGTELEDVKKAAILDADVLTSTLSKFTSSLKKAKEFLEHDLKSMDEESEFQHCLASFVQCADSDISWLWDEERRIMALVKDTADYFHGKAGRDEGLRLFTIVRDFLIMLDKVCKEVRDNAATKPLRPCKKEDRTPSTSESPDFRQSPLDIRQRLFPAITDRRMYDSSSDDES